MKLDFHIYILLKAPFWEQTSCECELLCTPNCQTHGLEWLKLLFQTSLDELNNEHLFISSMYHELYYADIVGTAALKWSFLGFNATLMKHIFGSLVHSV